MMLLVGWSSEGIGRILELMFADGGANGIV